MICFGICTDVLTFSTNHLFIDSDVYVDNLLHLFQIISHFDFFWFIYFAMYLDILLSLPQPTFSVTARTVRKNSVNRRGLFSVTATVRNWPSGIDCQGR